MTTPDPALPLGAFSISLSVKVLTRSLAFYEVLGFRPIAGAAAAKWLILRNGTTTIGLFQDHLPSNTLTFNPGWDGANQPLTDFVDVRELQRRFRAAGITPTLAADEATTGPAHCIVVDPDGNPILFDQHV